MMLTRQPDQNLGAQELELAVNLIKGQLTSAHQWQFREEYIDRGHLDPYYILMIRKPEEDKMDDLGDQKVFKSKVPGLSFVNRTSSNRKYYWEDIRTVDLVQRLDRFRTAYAEQALQPPGLRGDLFDPRDPHEVFPKRRYIYELLTPFKQLTGIGPGKYALGLGAICGTVLGSDGLPKDGVEVVLHLKEETITRRTREGGLFWFSKVPAGTWKLTANQSTCTVEVLRRDEFGHIKGWLTDQDGLPAAYTEMKFHAPDREVFQVYTDASGKFTTGPVPAFPVADTPLSKYPYLMEVPDFMFSIAQSVFVKDAVLGGVLKSEQGAVLAGREVTLKQNGQEVARTTSDAMGHFQFFGLAGGTYQLGVDDSRLYLSRLPAGRIEGSIPEGVAGRTTVELVVKDQLVATERISRDRAFVFDQLAPGNYSIHSKNQD